MARSSKVYTRLTRNASGLGVMTSLWLATDHLLVVRSTGYSENYARLRLRDIKGFFITRSDRRLWWGLGWGALALLSAIPLGLTLVARQTPIVSAIIFGVAAIFGIWNQLLGPGCRLYVVTGVQTLPLPALVRMKRTRRVLERLQPLIVAEQAGMEAGPPVQPVPPPVPARS